VEEKTMTAEIIGFSVTALLLQNNGRSPLYHNGEQNSCNLSVLAMFSLAGPKNDELVAVKNL